MNFEVGQKIGPFTKPPVTKFQLVKYSGASGDFNPIHTVEESAQSAGLGGVIAHGMLTMGFVGQMLTDLIGVDGRLQTFQVRFVDMVRPGDTIRCSGQVTSVEAVGNTEQVHCHVIAHVVEGERPVVTGSAVFSVPLA